MGKEAVRYLKSERRGLFAVLLLSLSMVAGPLFLDWQERREIRRQQSAPIYAAPRDVSWAIEGGALHFTGISRKLEDCIVVEGSPVTLAAEISTGLRAHAVRGYAALHPAGRPVLAAPLVSKDREFAIGPFVIRDDPEVLRRIVGVTVNLTCRFLATGVIRQAVIGPIEIVRLRDDAD